MAKPQRESPVPSTFATLQLREAEDDVAISKGSPKGRQQCLARAKGPIAFRHCEERSDEAISEWAA